MCGISGIIRQSASSQLHTPELPVRLKAMTASMKHRGPDGQQTWISPAETAAFAHCRLAIIDLSNAASQPMHYHDRYTIVHNGEIYNYIELRQRLSTHGYTFKTASDTEVILAAYDHYADECVDHFDGMFAFAIWDEKEQELFAARDRFGEKPFYYALNNKEFVFGSELKTLWSAGIEKKPNLQMLFNFITIGYTDNPGRPEETFFENIFKLPASSTLYYTPSTGELVVEKYWDIDHSAQNKTITDAEALEKFTALLTGSVTRRLRSDVNIGTCLSGGLDSSTIVSLTSSILNETLTADAARKPMKAFTGTFTGFERDESAFASRAARELHLDHHMVNITVDDFVNDWDNFLHYQEEPFGSASAYAQFKVYELAGRHQVKVLLDGQGADETLAGYQRYYKWYWQELFLNRKLSSSGEVNAAREIGVRETFTFKNVVASLFPDIASVILERRYLVNALRLEDLSKDFVRLQSKEAYYSTPAHFDLNGSLYFNTMVHGLEELLRHADRNSMAHGLEVRLPFLDHQLVEFIFSLPGNFKIRKGWTKWILRQAMTNILPGDIVWRKDKVGFEPPQRQWMEDARVKEMIMDARKKLVTKGVLNKQVLQAPFRATGSHDGDTFDWRYLASAYYL